MPAQYGNAILTNKGAELLTKAQAGLCKIAFVKMAIGNGTYSANEKTVSALQQRTALKSQKNTYTFSDVYVYSEKSVKLTALISNYDSVNQQALVTTGYWINEIGLFAKEQGAADSTAILYSISVCSDAQGDYLPPYNGYNPAQITQDYFATVDNSLEVIINTAGAALLVEDANKIMDDTTHIQYKLGIDNGALYYQEVES